MSRSCPRTRLRARALAVLIGLATLVAGAALAAARPGGGHSFSGGFHSSGGGFHSSGGHSHGGGGELIYLLFYLVVNAPAIGVPVLLGIIVLGVLWLKNASQSSSQAWDSAAALPPPPPPSLDQLRGLDPDFSQVLFEDFLFRLYAQAHTLRGTPGGLASLAPYFNLAAQETLVGRPPGAPLRDIVIGAMHLRNLNLPPYTDTPQGRQYATAGADGKPYFVQLRVEFESNMSTATGEAHSFYVKERWWLARAADVRSKPPGKSRDFPCPNCGAPFSSTDNQTCSYCGEVVNSGRFDWLVTSVQLLTQEQRPPPLGGYAEEQGTFSDSIVAPDFYDKQAALQADDPQLTDQAFGARVALIYKELNQGWTARDIEHIRPYVSDGLCDYLRYWLEAYQRQGLINRLENMAITNWQMVKVVRDRHYDAITVRLWATGIDTTVRADDGKRVGGNPRSPRPYSEYWTLIRGAGVRGAPRTDPQCPNCGAELKIGMSGVCVYCGVHVTAGEFDWVLSKIEQDEAYAG